MYTDTVQTHTIVRSGGLCDIRNRNRSVTSYLIPSTFIQQLTQHDELCGVRRVSTNSIGGSTSGGGKDTVPHHASGIKGASDTEQCHGVICGAGNDKGDTVITQMHSI